MKIEIEYEEVESLRKQIEFLMEERDRLQAEIKDLRPEELKRDADHYAHAVVKKCLSKIFASLGFEERSSDIHFDDSTSYSRKEWWKRDDIKIELGASVAESFRYAFLRIGVVPPNDKDKLKELFKID